MKSTSRFWSSLLTLLICISYYGRTDATCRRIPLKSVLDAIDACRVARRDDLLKEGKPMLDPTTNRTTGFTIKKVLREDYRGIPIVAFRASDETNTTTIIAFRATSCLRQFWDELKGAAEAKAIVQFPASRGRQPDNVKILNYFYNAYQALNHPFNLLPDGIDENKKYIITGHSLGGALASIFALHQVKRFTERSKVFWRDDLDNVLITFGQPRVGNIDYAETHDAVIPPYKKLRFVHYKDPVAIMPKGHYKHHGTKIFLDNKDNKDEIRVCPQGDEPEGCKKYRFQGKTYHAGKRYKEAIEKNKIWLDEFGGSHPTFEQSQCVPRPEVLKG